MGGSALLQEKQATTHKRTALTDTFVSESEGAAATSDVCTEECQDEFMKCFTAETKAGHKEAYSTCKANEDFQNACDDCADTDAMKELQNATEEPPEEETDAGGCPSQCVEKITR